MNNCLVTKLKSSVNNEDLSKLNVLTIKNKSIDSPTVNTQWLNIGTSENGSVSINSPSVGLYQSGISGALNPYPINIPANTILDSHFENKDGIIEITGKYNLSRLHLGNSATVRIKEIYGIPGTLVSIRIKNIEEGEGKVDATRLTNAFNKSMTNVIEFPVEEKNVINKLSGNRVVEFAAIQEITPPFCYLFDNLGLDDIANNVNIKLLQMYGLSAGNLSSLAKLTKLESIMFSNKKQNTGDIMDFINPWIQAGRTNGKLKTQFLRGQIGITLNGSPITFPEGSYGANETCYINWTSDGTVTFTAS